MQSAKSRFARGEQRSILATQCADELSAIGVPGIWFPFGIGVSRTQCACALAIPLLAVLIVRTMPSKRATEGATSV